jgi:nucleotide-binding universal stress UspA family protein
MSASYVRDAGTASVRVALPVAGNPHTQRAQPPMERARRAPTVPAMRLNTVDAGTRSRDAVAFAKRFAHTRLIAVTGSRGYGPLRSVLVGGVSGKLIRKAHCPVIVGPRGAQQSPAADRLDEQEATVAGHVRR